eukprot:GHVQ01008819.1.p1 GENE.GHVQ01008819.1~~GHVQ01008819.1.p1  ORF type:complete len:199 (-),score=61.17 GHVQ01008819.1:579-1175(-)
MLSSSHNFSSDSLLCPSSHTSTDTVSQQSLSSISQHSQNQPFLVGTDCEEDLNTSLCRTHLSVVVCSSERYDIGGESVKDEGATGAACGSIEKRENIRRRVERLGRKDMSLCVCDDGRKIVEADDTMYEACLTTTATCDINLLTSTTSLHNTLSPHTPPPPFSPPSPPHPPTPSLDGPERMRAWEGGGGEMGRVLSDC